MAGMRALFFQRAYALVQCGGRLLMGMVAAFFPSFPSWFGMAFPCLKLSREILQLFVGDTITMWYNLVP